MMESSLIWWKQERSHMMAKELADPVGATKRWSSCAGLCPSPWHKVEPSRALALPHHTPHFIDQGVGAQSKLLQQQMWRRRSSLHRITSHMVEFVHMLTWGVRRAQTAGEKREKGEEND